MIDDDIAFSSIPCMIEGAEPLTINLLGRSIPQSKESTVELKFESIVRVPKSQKVMIKNPTAKPWKIKTSISAGNPAFKNYFQGKDSLEVPANGQAEY